MRLAELQQQMYVVEVRVVVRVGEDVASVRKLSFGFRFVDDDT